MVHSYVYDKLQTIWDLPILLQYKQIGRTISSFASSKTMTVAIAKHVRFTAYSTSQRIVIFPLIAYDCRKVKGTIMDIAIQDAIVFPESLCLGMCFFWGRVDCSVSF